MAQKSPQPMNPWEARALDYQFPTRGPDGTAPSTATWQQVQDPVIYPGLYSATGFDIMTILLQVFSRPNPQIEVGAVDCSVALVLCDLQQPDMPIVYVSDTFCELTGYSRAEALGKNCRFLQSPGGGGPNGFQQTTANHGVIRSIRQAVRGQKEIQTEIINYKKNGQRFKNFLSIIPVQPCSAGYRYAVGMMVEAE